MAMYDAGGTYSQLLCFLQDDTPKPISKDVFIQKSPAATFFVSQYGGFGMDDITVSAKVCTHRFTANCAWLFVEQAVRVYQPCEDLALRRLCHASCL